MAIIKLSEKIYQNTDKANEKHLENTICMVKNNWELSNIKYLIELQKQSNINIGLS